MSPEEILYKCPKCDKNLVSPAKHAGKLGECPACREGVMVPARSDRFPFMCQCGRRLFGKRSMIGQAVKCPFCGKVVEIPGPAIRDVLPDETDEEAEMPVATAVNGKRVKLKRKKPVLRRKSPTLRRKPPDPPG